MLGPRLLAFVSMVALCGCEFFVDPVVQGSNSTGAAGAIGSSSGTSGSSAAASAGSSTSSSSGSGSGSTSGSSSSSSGGTTGTCGAHGTTGGVVQSCPAQLPAPAPLADYPLGPIPDSTSTCANDCVAGSDDAWKFATDTYCDDVTYALDGGTMVTFQMSLMTRVAWLTSQAGAANDLAGARSICSGDVDAGLLSLPTPWEGIQALDFGSGNGAAPATWHLSIFDYTWAESGDHHAWLVNFDDGTFNFRTQDGGAWVRCVASGPNTGTTTPPQVQVSPNAGPNNEPQVELRFANGQIRYTFDETNVQTNWQGAITICNELPNCGDWRLPSYKELATLVDFTKFGVGRGGEVGSYWTSTDASNTPMVITFPAPDAGTASGTRSFFPNTDSHGVICIHNP